MPKKYDGPNQTDPYPVRKLRVFLSGLRLAASYNFAATYKIIVSLIAIVLGYFAHDLVDLLIIFVACGTIVTAELMNSAIEEICDFIHPEKDDRIGGIKDIAAAGAGVAMLVWVIVMFYEFGTIAVYFFGGFWTPPQ